MLLYILPGPRGKFELGRASDLFCFTEATSNSSLGVEVACAHVQDAAANTAASKTDLFVFNALTNFPTAISLRLCRCPGYSTCQFSEGRST